MRTVFLMRHAKATHERRDSDRVREITETGVERTKKVIGHLKKHSLQPSLIVSSPALRASETAQLVADGFQLSEKQLVFEEKIYSGSVESLENILFALDDSLDSVMLVGHNPVMSDLAYVLGASLDIGMPTSGVVVLRFAADKWNKISGKRGEQLLFVQPKKLEEL